jgi:hypothetical protein
MYKKKITPQVEQWIIETYTTPAEDGSWIGCNTISQSVGLTTHGVQHVLKRNGIKLRDATESHANGKRCKPVKNLPPEGEQAPFCKCGCGLSVRWNQRKNRWNVYVDGHYRKDALYKSAEWLREQYEGRKRTVNDIAQECGVHGATVRKFMSKFNIAARPQAESLVLSGAVRGSNNPAWKGGIANWSYAPGWKRIARSIRKRDNYTCQMCGTQFPKTSKLLHVHHKDGDKFNNEPSNLETVCATCHPKGKRREGWKHHHIPDRQYVITRYGEVFGFDPNEWMSTKEAREQIGLTASHIVDLGKRGFFHIEKKGGFWYIDRKSFDAFASTHQRYKHYSDAPHPAQN